MPNNRLSLKEFLLIAEAVLRISYDELERAVCIFRAESALAAPFVRVCGSFFFPDPVDQAAVCAYRLIRTQPLPWGNWAVGYEAMREMLVLGERFWSHQDEDPEGVEEFLKRVEAGEVGLGEFLRWVRERVRA